MKFDRKTFNNYSAHKQKMESWHINTLGKIPASVNIEYFSGALRTYATWLVRATRRKMAGYEPENTPMKSRIDLTKDGH